MQLKLDHMPWFSVMCILVSQVWMNVHAVNNGSCDQLCNDIIPGYFCSCYHGYQLLPYIKNNEMHRWVLASSCSILAAVWNVHNVHNINWHHTLISILHCFINAVVCCERCCASFQIDNYWNLTSENRWLKIQTSLAFTISMT